MSNIKAYPYPAAADRLYRWFNPGEQHYMGFITNQWLKGNPQRNRKHGPVKGSVTVLPSNDKWSKDNNIVLEVTLRKWDGSYQSISMTQEEINKLLPTVFATGEPAIRMQIALSAMSGLSDAELLKWLGILLGKRNKP